jgi:hypothetical protein
MFFGGFQLVHLSGLWEIQFTKSFTMRDNNIEYKPINAFNQVGSLLFTLKNNLRRKTRITFFHIQRMNVFGEFNVSRALNFVFPLIKAFLYHVYLSII